MKKFKLVALIIFLLGAIPATSVWARGGNHFGHHHGWEDLGLGLALGYGLGYGYRSFGDYGWGYSGYRYRYGGYYPPYYVYPPVATVHLSPPIYIQQQSTNQSAIESPSDHWYYCRKPEGYYPHVKKCPEGWMQVVPQPPAQ